MAHLYVCDYHHGESSLKCEFHPPFPKVYASKDIDRHYRHGDPADLKLGMLTWKPEKTAWDLNLKKDPHKTREKYGEITGQTKNQGRNGSMKMMKLGSPYLNILNKSIEHPWTLLETCGNWQTNLLKFMTREMQFLCSRYWSHWTSIKLASTGCCLLLHVVAN